VAGNASQGCFCQIQTTLHFATMAYYEVVFESESQKERMETTMTIKLDIPEDRLGMFQRMKRQLPLEIRENPEVLQKLLIYLKLGGDRLVRQVVATLKVEFPEDTQIFKHRLVEENLETGDEDGDGDSSSSKDDAVDENDDEDL
jgi:hypothetical protein